MTQITFKDAANAARPTDVFSWSWRGAHRCTAAMLIEERLRGEHDRVIGGGAPSIIFTELSFETKIEARLQQMVDRAFKAFAAGKILLLVDDRQVVGLDAPIDVTDGMEIVFLRLVPLQAG